MDLKYWPSSNMLVWFCIAKFIACNSLPDNVYALVDPE